VNVSGFSTAGGNNGTRTVTSSTPSSLGVSGGAALTNESPQSVTSSQISASTTDDSFNHAGAGFPIFGAGARIKTSGFANAANNGEFTISSNTSSKIVVLLSNLVTEAAGPSITVAGPSVTMVFTQAATERDVMLKAPRFDHNSDVAELQHVFTGGPAGSEFQLLGTNVDTPSAFTTGHKLRAVLAARERDTEQESRIARLEVERTGSGSGSLTIDTYQEAVFTPGQQESHNPPALKIDSAGKAYLNRSSGTGQLNVGGDVRADTYKKAGAALGKWTLNTASGELPRYEYTGTAEVTGQLRSVVEDLGDVMRVESTTKCTNLNAAKLRGEKYPSSVLTAKTSGGVTVPARYGSIFDQFDVTASTISVDSTDNSFNSSEDIFWDSGAGDVVTASGFDNQPNNGTFTIVSTTPKKVKVLGNQPLVTEAAGASRTLQFAIGYTTLCQTVPITKAGYYKIMARVSVPANNAGNLSDAFYLNIPGALPAPFFLYITDFYATAREIGDTVQIVGLTRYRAAAGEVLRLGLSNPTEANVTVTGALVAKWLAPGIDVLPPRITIPFTLYTPTAV
jgi:hypothetical protein